MPHLWVFYMFSKLPSVDLRTFPFFSIFRQSVPEYFGSMDQMHSFTSKCPLIPLPPNFNVAGAARATFSSIEI